MAAVVLLTGGAAAATQGWVPTPKRQADLTSNPAPKSTATSTPSTPSTPSASPTAQPQAVQAAGPTIREEKAATAKKATERGKAGSREARLARKVRQLTRPKPTPTKPSAPAPAPAPTTSFRVASINTLGHSHTRKGGNKRGYRSGPDRTRQLVQILRDQNLEVAGLQEFEDEQKAAFSRMAVEWDRFTGTDRGRDSIVYRTAVWEFVRGGTGSIPYFHGKPVPMPWVTLRHRVTQRVVSFLSIHNPTSNAKRGNNQRHRTTATRREIDMVRQLASDGNPVLLLGDFNERREAFCMVTGGGDIGAANGGSTGGNCSPPPDMGIDWVFGTVDTAFSEYQRLKNARTSRMTDHPVIMARATITEALPGR